MTETSLLKMRRMPRETMGVKRPVHLTKIIRFCLVSRLKSSFKNSAAPPHMGRWSVRAATSPQCHRQRPIASIRSLGRHRGACQSESFSSGATRGDYEANGAVQGTLEQIDCGLEDHLPTGVGPHSGVMQRISVTPH
jgi:hypothetical protein